VFTLNIIGAGRVGKSLGLIWRRAGVAKVGAVFCRSEESAIASVECIGGGTPVTEWNAIRPSDIHLVAVPDDALPSTVESLADHVDLAGSVVFHTSGWLTASALSPAAEAGAFVASVHPIKGFPDPESAAGTFAGTWCGVEGDQRALDVLRPAFKEVDAQLVSIEEGKKPLYHAATIVACNYVIGLTDLAHRALIAAGIESERAMAMLGPLLQTTAENLVRFGPVETLTGPVARGDVSTVAAHLEALQEWNEKAARTYVDQAGLLVDVARRKGTSVEALDRIERLLTAFE
jgi:predicted short-subunit dehydrogenase-like oxidoreductase (DUF2520 family)